MPSRKVARALAVVDRKERSMVVMRVKNVGCAETVIDPRRNGRPAEDSDDEARRTSRYASPASSCQEVGTPGVVRPRKSVQDPFEIKEHAISLDASQPINPLLPTLREGQWVILARTERFCLLHWVVVRGLRPEGSTSFDSPKLKAGLKRS